MPFFRCDREQKGSNPETEGARLCAHHLHVVAVMMMLVVVGVVVVVEVVVGGE
jgi:hypothetical protein